MPAILHRRDYDGWLNREEVERPPVHLLRPFEAEGMRVHPAHPKVGNVRNQGMEMLDSVWRKGPLSIGGRGPPALREALTDSTSQAEDASAKQSNAGGLGGNGCSRRLNIRSLNLLFINRGSNKRRLRKRRFIRAILREGAYGVASEAWYDLRGYEHECGTERSEAA